MGDAKFNPPWIGDTILLTICSGIAGVPFAGGPVISDMAGFFILWSGVAAMALLAGISTIPGGGWAGIFTETVRTILIFVGAMALFVIRNDDIRGWQEFLGGLPFLIHNELTGIWPNRGSPEVHDVAMSPIVLFIGICAFFSLSAMIRQTVPVNIGEHVWFSGRLRRGLSNGRGVAPGASPHRSGLRSLHRAGARQGRIERPAPGDLHPLSGQL